MIGTGSNISAYSYAAMGRETTFGTGVTCSASFNFLSFSLKTTKEGKILEEVSRHRTHSQRISLGKKIEGEVEMYIKPAETACSFFLQNAFGGSVTSSEISATAAYSHEFKIGAMNLTHTAISINARKGDATNGQVFEYKGVRVNELGIMAELDEAAKMTLGLICKDSTATTNDIESALTVTASEPFTFVGGRFSVETTFASLTSSSYWNVQSVEFKLSNSLKADNDSRRIGSDVLSILPPGIASFELSASIRFDTTTAYDAMMAGTKLSAEFEFVGSTLTGSSTTSSLTLAFPEVYVNEAGDPEIGGPDEILKSDVTFHVMRDTSSATGYACTATLVNGTATI